MKLYRYERCYAGEYELGIKVREFWVTAETPKGYWILDYSERTWVSKTGKKRFAYPTKAEALFAFQKRTERALSIQRVLLQRSASILGIIKQTTC